MEELVLNVVVNGLKALAAVAPAVASVFTGGRDIDEIAREAHEALARSREKKLARAWDEDLKERLGGGEPPSEG